MGLLQKLKSVLGLDGTTSSGTGRTGDVDVTVEREPSTKDEDAVKGTDTADANSTVESEASGTDTEPVVTDESDTEPEVPDDEPSEPDASSEEDTDDESEEGDTAAEDEAETDEESESEDEDSPGSDDPVTEIKGIGPAYADRLAGQGIDTVGELAAADAAAIAAETDLGEGRVTDWIERAQAY
jgi:predicted flap endonuclease-1-like 5' DNA nuclease